MKHKQPSMLRQAIERVIFLLYMGLVGAIICALIHMRLTPDFSGETLLAAACIGFIGGMAITIYLSNRP